jgi:hypothetical protein
MFFLNLSLPEFLAILGSLSGVVVALYLLDRCASATRSPRCASLPLSKSRPY